MSYRKCEKAKADYPRYSLGNGWGGMIVQKNQLKRKNNLFSACIFGHPLSVRPAYKSQKRSRKRENTGDKRSLQKEMK